MWLLTLSSQRMCVDSLCCWVGHLGDCFGRQQSQLGTVCQIWSLCKKCSCLMCLVVMAVLSCLYNSRHLTLRSHVILLKACWGRTPMFLTVFFSWKFVQYLQSVNECSELRAELTDAAKHLEDQVCFGTLYNEVLNYHVWQSWYWRNTSAPEVSSFIVFMNTCILLCSRFEHLFSLLECISLTMFDLQELWGYYKDVPHCSCSAVWLPASLFLGDLLRMYMQHSLDIAGAWFQHAVEVSKRVHALKFYQAIRVLYPWCKCMTLAIGKMQIDFFPSCSTLPCSLLSCKLLQRVLLKWRWRRPHWNVKLNSWRSDCDLDFAFLLSSCEFRSPGHFFADLCLGMKLAGLQCTSHFQQCWLLNIQY